MGKIRNWYNRNFESGGNNNTFVGDPDTQLEMENLKQLANNIKEARGHGNVPDIDNSDNEGAKLFIDAYDKTNKLAHEKSYIFDKLDEIFKDQKEFTLQIDNKFKDKPFSCYNFSKKEYDIYYDINCAIEELVEAIRELNTKKWKQETKQVHNDKVLEELVDCTKFIHQAILRLGYNANDFYEKHRIKSEENRQRQKNNY